MIKNSKFQIYLKIFNILEKKHKFQIGLVLFFLIFVSLVEIISLSSVIPFIMAIQEPNLILNSIYYKEYLADFNLNKENLGTYFFIFFALLVIFTLILKVLFLKINCHISYDISRHIGDLIFSLILSKNFVDFNSLISKDIVTTIALRSQSVGETIYNLISSLGSLVIIIFLTLNSLFFIGSKIIFLLISLSILYLFWWAIIKKKITKYGIIFSENYEKLIKNTSEVMNMFSEIKLYNLKNFFLNEFKKNNYDLRKSQGKNTFVSSYPSVVIQSFIILGLIILIFLWSKYSDLKNQIPILTFLVLTLQRLIPNFQNIFRNYSGISYMSENLKKTTDIILKENNSKDFSENIKNFKEHEQFKEIFLDNVSYKINEDNNNHLLENINLKIKKGDKIALMGPSGSGKTTLINILMGFIDDISGKILVNEKNLKTNLSFWHGKIAYVPQKIFMLQKDIYTNISLKNKVSDKEKKDIDDMLNSFNLKTELMADYGLRKSDEGGKGFSGGQLQRLAIARSLYRKREFLILDETLNALDMENSVKIINDLKKKEDLTVLLITHNDRIASQMNRIIKIKDCKLNES